MSIGVFPRWAAPVTSGPSRDEVTCRNLFWLFLAAHVALWIGLPLLVHPNAPLDVIEGMAWGREWALGYHKGPPMFAWIMGLLDPLPPEMRLAAVFAVSQGAVGLTFYAVWRLSLRLFPPPAALLSVVLLEGVYYFGFPTPELNENVLQMPASAMLARLFHRAVGEDRLRDWLLVGALAALGMWTRYSSAVLLISLAIFIMLPANQAVLRRPGPWIAVTVLALLWLPHAVWMIATGFQSVNYVAGRAKALVGIWDHLAVPLSFAASQALALAPAVLLALLLRRRSAADGAERPAPVPLGLADRQYVAVIAFGPFVVAELLSLATGWGLRTMWGAPLWCFVGLFAVTLTRPSLSPSRLRPFVQAWTAVFMLPLLVYGHVHGYRALVVPDEKRSTFPGPALAATVTEGWHLANGERRLRYVVGPMWLAGNVAFYSPDRPSVYEEANPRSSPWINQEDLAGAGAVLLWSAGGANADMPSYLLERFPEAVKQPVMTLPRRSRFSKMPARVGWAILWPAADPLAVDAADPHR